HWIDSETQALLDSLVESLPTARVLLLVNYRPEYQHGWGGKTYYTQLRIDPLAAESAAALLDALLGAGRPLEPLKRLLLGRTEGNPFFLEESVRTLVETGVIVGERGSFRLAKPLDAIQVPATVQAVLAARIDRLPPAVKHLLQSAAVIGKTVAYPLLETVAGMAEAEARHASALGFYESSVQALGRLGDGADRLLEVDAYLELWSTRISTGRTDGLDELGRKVEALARALDDGPRLARVQVRQAQA